MKSSSAFESEYKPGLTLDRGLETRSKDMMVRSKRNRRERLKAKRAPPSTSEIVNDSEFNDYDFIGVLMSQVDLNGLLSPDPESTITQIHKIFAFKEGEVVLSLFDEVIFKSEESLILIDHLVRLFNQAVTPYNAEMMRQLGWILLVIGYHENTGRYLNRMVQARYLPAAFDHLKLTDDYIILDCVLSTLNNACQDTSQTRDFFLANGLTVTMQLFQNRMMNYHDEALKFLLLLEVLNFVKNCLRFGYAGTMMQHIEGLWFMTKTIEDIINPLDQMTPVETEMYLSCIKIYIEMCKNAIVRRRLAEQPNFIPAIVSKLTAPTLNRLVLARLMDWIGYLCDEEVLQEHFLQSNILEISVTLLGQFTEPDMIIQTIYVIYRLSFDYAVVTRLFTLGIMDILSPIFQNIQNKKVKFHLLVLVNLFIRICRDYSPDPFKKNECFQHLLQKNIFLYLEQGLKHYELQKVVHPTILSIAIILEWNAKGCKPLIEQTTILDSFEDFCLNKTGFDSRPVTHLLKTYFDNGEEDVIEMDMRTFDF